MTLPLSEPSSARAHKIRVWLVVESLNFDNDSGRLVAVDPFQIALEEIKKGTDKNVHAFYTDLHVG